MPYWAPPLRPTLPTVVTVHDLIPLLLPAYRTSASVRAYTALVARATRMAAAVLADSAHTARDIARHLEVDPARVHVVPLGVESLGERPTDAEIAAVRRRLDLPPRFGLYLGGFDVRKNLGTLCAAWVSVHAATGVPLVMAGRLPAAGDPFAPHPAELALRAGLDSSALRLVGPVAEVEKHALLASAALFAFPSRYEGFGLPPLEAMAAGTPVVAADATSLPEVVGDAGLLVDPDAVADWAAALQAVLEDDGLAERLRSAGRERARAFSWSATAALTRAVYAGVCGAR